MGGQIALKKWRKTVRDERSQLKIFALVSLIFEKIMASHHPNDRGVDTESHICHLD